MMRWLHKSCLWYYSTIALLCTCTAATAQDDDVGQVSQGIRGGDVILGSPGVVEFKQPNSGCTGSIIAEDAILTAAHCLDFLGSAGVRSGVSIFEIVYHHPKEGRKLIHSGFARWFEHPQYAEKPPKLDSEGKPDVPPSDTPEFDIAVIKVPKPFPDLTYRDYLPLYRDSTQLVRNQRWIRFFGAGRFMFGGEGDNQLRTTRFLLEDITANWFTLDNRKPTRVCKGDSGGPAVYELSGTSMAILGVASQSNAPLLGSDDCAVATPGWDNSTFARTSRGNVSALLRQAGLSCAEDVEAGVLLTRCYRVGNTTVPPWLTLLLE